MPKKRISSKRSSPPKKRSLSIARTLWIIALLAAILAFTWFFVTRLMSTQEPLADADSLAALMEGKPLPEPTDETTATFHGLPATAPKLATLTQVARILGVTTPEVASNKRIEVDLTNQKVYAYEGDSRVYEFLVSTGKWGRTPTGEFTIWVKVKSQVMSGGSKALHTYYYLPNVPWVMFFYNKDVAKSRGFSFHGTYWHNNFGHPMSHGCINMRIEDAKVLYDWATPVVTNAKAWSTLANAENPGTRVVIYGETPQE